MKNFTRKLSLIVSFAMILLVNSCKKDDPVVAPQTGQALFWTASQTLGGSFINISIDGKSVGSITLYATSAPACDVAGYVTVTKTPGTYNWTGTGEDNTQWSGTVTITSNQCFKVELTGPGGTGGGTGTGGTGQVVFWTRSDFGCGNIAVAINNVTRTISGFSSAGAPNCDASGAASFTLAPGTYNYTASCTGKSWSGTVTVTQGLCNKLELVSGSGGGSSAGQVMFWTQSNLACGNINVVLGSQTNVISSFYSSGAPDCGASGCATFTLSPGTYNYTASCTGKTWSGSVTVTSAGCSRTELTGSTSGGGGGGAGTCASTNAFVVANGVIKNICGNTNDVEVTVKNNSNQRLAIQIAIERTNGTWSCGIANVNPGATGSYWICKGTGKYSIRSMLDSDWLAKCNFGTCP